MIPFPPILVKGIETQGYTPSWSGLERRGMNSWASGLSVPSHRLI